MSELAVSVKESASLTSEFAVAQWTTVERLKELLVVDKEERAVTAVLLRRGRVLADDLVLSGIAVDGDGARLELEVFFVTTKVREALSSPSPSSPEMRIDPASKDAALAFLSQMGDAAIESCADASGTESENLVLDALVAVLEEEEEEVRKAATDKAQTRAEANAQRAPPAPPAAALNRNW
jgi:hypothetical protein